MSLKSHFWPLKIASKMVLSRLPIGYGFWKKLGLFEWGAMDNHDYPINVFTLHKNKVFKGGLPEKWVGLEIGPGDSIASGMMAWAHGAQKTYLIDAGSFVSKDINFYKCLSRSFEDKGFKVPELSKANSFEDILNAHNIVYLTNGLDSLKSIPSEHVDFLWSHSVLEHVRAHEFNDLMVESARCLKSRTGRISHNIDLMDHLAKSLNNMRFKSTLWESDFWAKSGFYTNRLRASQILDAMTHAGLNITDLQTGAWDKPPVPRDKIAPEFRTLSDKDLCIRTMHVTAQK
tara:strand:- start:78133 stop:78996 length:864 start_codon:yes stop_codon:yes gene_type:complete